MGTQMTGTESIGDDGPGDAAEGGIAEGDCFRIANMLRSTASCSATDELAMTMSWQSRPHSR